LKDYKYRTLGFKALSISGGFSGEVGNASALNVGQSKMRGFYLAPSQINYTRFISTDKRVHTSSFSFFPSAESFYNELNGKDENRSNLHYQFGWDFHDRFYNKTNWFFEVGNRLIHGLDHNRYSDSVYHQRFDHQELYDQATLGFGKGRIEMVGDAQMALFILNDLQQQGLLNGPVLPEVASNFARLITDIHNQRVFDFRRKRIYEFTQIDSFLRSNGLVSTPDIRHFTIINDNWTLAYTPNRLSGSNWFLRLQPSAGIRKSTSENSQSGSTLSSRQTTKDYTLFPVVGYEKFVPVNLRWQRNMSISLSWTSEWENTHSNYNNNGTASEDNNDRKVSQSLFSSY
jgi:hypothetical protein